MNKPNIVKKQHVVPQFYLKHFADRKGRLYVYDKVRNSQHAANVKDVAQKNGFYNISMRPDALPENEPFDPQCIEHTLATIELPLSTAIKDIVATGARMGLPTYKRNAASAFLALQLYRTVEFREVMSELIQREMRHRVNEWMKANYPDDLELTPHMDWSEDYWVAAQSVCMFDPEFVEDMRGYLKSLYWLVGVNRTGTPLYTSDNPVTYFSHFPVSINQYGIKSPGVEIVCPLSPELALILRDKDLPMYLTLPSGVIVEDRARVNDGGITELSEENVARFNWWQVARSHRQVFSTISDFKIAHKFRRANP